MNYRHAFHAGSFADVLKHVVLVRILLHLNTKETAYRLIETHAGAGRYDLGADPAQRTGEWRDGIGRLLAHPPSGEAGNLLEPYVALVRAANSTGELRSYPGSPAIALSLARIQDRLIFCEVHPAARSALAATVGRDRRVKVVETDGWTALKAYIPPRERRGLVLIDPSFERSDEFRRIEDGLAAAHRRWATGICLVWYPIKERSETDTFARRISRLGIAKVLRVELVVRPVPEDRRLHACGLIAVNPPWKLERELTSILPALADTLGRDGAASFRLDRLAP